MAVATQQLDLYLLAAEGLVHRRADVGSGHAEPAGAELEGENIREVLGL